MSLRARLSLLVVGAVALGLVLVSVVTYGFVASRVSRDTDQALVDRARAVAASTVSERGGVVVVPVENLVDAVTFIQVIDINGTIKGASANLGTVQLPVDDGSLAVAQSGQSRTRTVSAGDTLLRVVEAPLTNPGARGASRPIGVVQVARSIAETQRDLRRLRAILLVGDLGALVLAAGLALVLTRAALRPLLAMRESAEEVAATGDPRRRLRGEASGSDEVARLAAAFDRMLERLDLSSSALGSALDSQRRFVADASHELRTPLTSARGNLEVLLRNPDMDPTERRQAISDAQAELERMGRLVDGLLTLARADAGGLATFERVPLSEVVERAHRAASRRAGGRTLELVDKLEDMEVMGSADTLRRLFDNLYDNALKYTEPEGHVTTTAERRHGWAVVSVSDDGAGIEPDQLPRIFERFYRTPGARSAEGSGLGLAIVHRAAVLHGGTVSVSSMPGRGSTFLVSLPIANRQAGGGG